MCFISRVLPICPPHCHLKCRGPGALGWWLSGQGKESDFPEAVLQGLVASVFVIFDGVVTSARFLSVFHEEPAYAGVIQAARQLLSDERSLRQKLLADLLEHRQREHRGRDQGRGPAVV